MFDRFKNSYQQYVDSEYDDFCIYCHKRFALDNFACNNHSFTVEFWLCKIQIYTHSFVIKFLTTTEECFLHSSNWAFITRLSADLYHLENIEEFVSELDKYKLFI